MTVKEHMIKAKALSYSYPSKTELEQPVVLKQIDLSIAKGSFVGILGANGSGKSTFSRLLNGLLLPAGGKIYADGMDTQDESLLLEIRRRIGLVFQNPDNQIVSSVVEDDVAFAPENLGIAPEEIRKRVEASLKAVGLAGFERHAPHLLSGGQKQRLAIAGILAMEPKCIVLDEATAMLDPKGRGEVLETVRNLNRHQGITVIFITHHMDECIGFDRLLVMDAGEIVKDGSPMEIFAQVDDLEALGLTVPQSTKLLYLLKKQGIDVPLGGFSTEECAQMIYNALSLKGGGKL